MPTNDPDMPAWAIRLEAKLDVVTAQQAQRLDTHETDLKDHEVRLRAMERDMPHEAHNRLRAVEERKTVAPAQLWTAVVTGAGAIGAASAALNVLMK